MSYTGENVRRDAEEYRDWARERDRDQYLAVTYQKLLAYAELRRHELAAMVRVEEMADVRI